MARAEFIKGKKQKLKFTLDIDILSTEFEFIRMLIMNPETGWKCISAMIAVMDEGLEVMSEIVWMM